MAIRVQRERARRGFMREREREGGGAQTEARSKGKRTRERGSVCERAFKGFGGDL